MRNENAAAVRDYASRRVRRLTAVAVAGAAALTGAFTSLAAGSTHHTKSTPSKQPAAAPTATTVTAPEPSLTPNGSTATPPSQQQSQPPPAPVTPSAQPPVAVTGGS